VEKKHKFKSNNFTPFTSGEIYEKIYKTKVNSLPGEDDIQNIFLKNLPFDYVKSVLNVLVNRSIASGIPLKWKKAKIIQEK